MTIARSRTMTPPPRSAVAAVAGSECQLWTAGIEDAHPRLLELLNKPERERLATYRRQYDSDTFLVSAAMLRLALATATGQAPAHLPVVRTCPSCSQPHGRPRLATGGDIQASVTHSGERVAVAVARVRVGVDIERVRDVPDVNMLVGVLSPPESAAVRELDGAAAVRAFLTSWVRRESVLKMIGVGLAADVSLTLSPPTAPPAVLSGPLPPYPSGPFYLYDLPAEDGYVGCLTAAGSLGRLVPVDGCAAIARWCTSPHARSAWPGQ